MTGSVHSGGRTRSDAALVGERMPCGLSAEGGFEGSDPVPQVPLWPVHRSKGWLASPASLPRHGVAQDDRRPTP